MVAGKGRIWFPCSFSLPPAYSHGGKFSRTTASGLFFLGSISIKATLNRSSPIDKPNEAEPAQNEINSHKPTLDVHAGPDSTSATVALINLGILGAANEPQAVEIIFSARCRRV